MDAQRNARLTLLLVAAALLALVCVRFNAEGGGQRPLSADEREYLVAAGNILRYGIYSDLPVTAGPAPPPTARRPPGYPLFAAAVLALPGGHATRIPEDLGDPGARAGLGALLWMQALLLWLTAAMSWIIVRRLTARHVWSHVAACAAGAAVALDGALQSSAHRFLSEPLALPLFVGLSWALMIAMTKPSRIALAAAALALALLVLTRPLTLHAAPVVAAIVVWGCRRRNDTLKRALADLLVFAAVFAPPVLGWMTRNALLLDRFFVAEGAGMVAGMRAELNRMTGAEYAASTLWWSGSRFAREKMLPGLASEWTGAALERAEDDRFERVMDRRAAMRRANPWPQADAAQSSEALRAILESPGDHIRLTPLAFLRGCEFHSTFAGGFVLVLAGSWAALSALRRREPGMIAFLAPAMTLLALNALLTHGIPRYSLVAIPVFWCAIAWLLFGPPQWAGGSQEPPPSGSGSARPPRAEGTA